MRYWITTHYPRRIDEDPTQTGVLAKERHEDIIERLKSGDPVFIYEMKWSPKLERIGSESHLDGAKFQKGREGVVALVKVIAPAGRRAPSKITKYVNQEPWCYSAKTEAIRTDGFLARREFLELLGHRTGWSLRGFGERQSGIREIDKGKYARIRDAYLAPTQTAEEQCFKRLVSRGVGGGGEGPEHLALKKAIVADPAAVLGELGLHLVDEEWDFSHTGDRVDVLLRDKFGRLVAVEVEVDCDKDHLAGPLQCMKYRAMLGYLFNRPVEETRCVLAARSIHPGVRARYEEYAVETRVVPPA